MRERYFVINLQTDIMHIYGCCHQTKAREIPLRLFEDLEQLQQYAGKPLRLCAICEKNRNTQA